MACISLLVMRPQSLLTSTPQHAMRNNDDVDGRLTRMGAGKAGGGASAMGLTSAKRLSAVTGTGDAKLGLGRPKGLKAAPDPPFAPSPAGDSHTCCTIMV